MKESLKGIAQILHRLPIKFLVILAVCMTLTIVFCKVVPYNMDEFVHYHAIICHHYSNNELNTFRERCGGYDFNILNTGLILPMRAYFYNGSFPCLYYYPVFRILRDPISARFLGILSLLLQSIILARIFNFRYEYILLFLAVFFPYFFQHMADTGPVLYMTLSVVLLYFLFDNWLRRQQWRHTVVIPFIIWSGIWSKLAYFWIIPSIGVMFLFIAFERRSDIRKKLKRILVQTPILIIVLAILLSTLFLSTHAENSNNRPYLQYLKDNNYRPIDEITNLDQLKQNHVFKSLINPLEATQRIYYVGKPSRFSYYYTLVLYLFVPVSVAIMFLLRRRRSVFRPLLFYFCFLLTVFMIIRTDGSWAMHHTVLSFPFLVMAMLSTAHILKTQFGGRYRLLIKLFFVSFIVLNSYFFMEFQKQEIMGHSDWSRGTVNNVLNNRYLAENYFYVVIDWGMYYYQGLYGPDSQSVLYMDPLKNGRDVDNLKKLSEQYNRKVLFIYNTVHSGSDLGLIKRSFPVKDCKLLEKDTVWSILIEEDSNSENICF